ncbi:YjfI family protein [Pseudomonas sp. GCM10022188]|uniref:biofilm formation regulator BacA n=1 Tax=Pseudomonas TaxID=286 RepID=UPI001E3AA0DD|nr:YjfI family protein [Pseudomonas oryzagri]MCC6077083.1 YjfI family protein [Pseudomonas oryzagri]
MDSKSSAHYQRLYRQRLREQGLVKKEVWIRPEHSVRLAALERKLRQPVEGLASMEEEGMHMPRLWTTAELHDALADVELLRTGRASMELLQGADPSLLLTLHEYGDLPLFAAVFGEQILVEALLWPQADVRDPAAFNEEVLRTHKLFPLSSIALETLADGRSGYLMFGALSAAASLADVVCEIETLADNVIKATEAYEDFLLVTVEESRA